MSDYPLFIPEFMLYTKSSLLWFKITTKLREFRNYLFYSLYGILWEPLFFRVCYARSGSFFFPSRHIPNNNAAAPAAAAMKTAAVPPVTGRRKLLLL